MPWQPTTWPDPPHIYVAGFSETLEKIIKETMLDEINNVISDANQVNGGLTHRGHVVILALMCAVDSIAAYPFSGGVGKRYTNFIKTYFPDEYQPFASVIYKLYRNSSVHNWNLFEVGIWPGSESVSTDGGSLSFGLLNFQDALTQAVESFLKDLPNKPDLQTNCIRRYTELKRRAV